MNKFVCMSMLLLTKTTIANDELLQAVIVGHQQYVHQLTASSHLKYERRLEMNPQVDAVPDSTMTVEWWQYGDNIRAIQSNLFANGPRKGIRNNKDTARKAGTMTRITTAGDVKTPRGNITRTGDPDFSPWQCSGNTVEPVSKLRKANES